MKHPTHRLLLVAGLLLTACLGPALVGAEERIRIMVVPIAVEENDNVLHSVAHVVSTTIARSLQLLGNYEVVNREFKDAVDSAISGTCTRNDNGAIQFDLRVTHGLTGEELFSAAHVAESLFGVFDVADEATISLLEAVSDTRIRFGTLRVVPDDSNLPYTVYLQEEPLETTTGPYQQERIVEGEYRIAVVQQRLNGPVTILEERIEVTAQRPTRVDVSFPVILDAEASLLAEQSAAAPEPGFPSINAAWRYPLVMESHVEIPGLSASAVVPAADEIEAWFADREYVRERMAVLLTGGLYHAPGGVQLFVRDIELDGEIADWQGIPPVVVEPDGSTPGAPQHRVMWRAALGAAADELHLLVLSPGITDAQSYRYRLEFGTVASDGDRTAGEIDLHPREAGDRAVMRLEADGSAVTDSQTVLPARIVATDGILEATIGLGEMRVLQPMKVSLALQEATPPYRRYTVPLETEATPVLSRLTRSASAHAFLPSTIAASETPLHPLLDVDVLAGRFAQAVREHHTAVDRHWRPTARVHASDGPSYLELTLHGLADADRVRATGPPGSNMQGVALVPLPEPGAYGSGILAPGRVWRGDEYRFSVQRHGFSFELSATVKLPAVRPLRSMTVESQRNAYDISWEVAPHEDDSARTGVAVVVTSTDGPVPRTDGELIRQEYGPDQTTATIPGTLLAGTDASTVYVGVRDRHGNYRWSSQRLHGYAVFQTIRHRGTREVYNRRIHYRNTTLGSVHAIEYPTRSAVSVVALPAGRYVVDSTESLWQGEVFERGNYNAPVPAFTVTGGSITPFPAFTYYWDTGLPHEQAARAPIPSPMNGYDRLPVQHTDSSTRTIHFRMDAAMERDLLDEIAGDPDLESFGYRALHAENAEYRPGHDQPRTQ